ncbi:MAG: sigma-70 family RNA polymerase sigma factor [Chthonomonas sp.]|nr:sigma-70 family RNA polymerase sigma factor [Chthonomonas sp.]
MQAMENNSVLERDFPDMMRQSYKKVFNLAYRLSGDRADAEDLTQEAFFRAYRGFDKYEGDRPFENWIFRIVTRLFLDLVRSRRRRVSTVSYDSPVRADGVDSDLHLQAPAYGPNPEEALLMNSLDDDLARALESLKPDQRTLVILADVEQMTYQDIAASLGIPVGTVRSRLHRAHKKLKSHLEAANKERERSTRGLLTSPSPCFGCV